MSERLYVLDVQAADPASGFVDKGVPKPYVAFDDSSDPPSARLYLPALFGSGLVTIAGNTITIPGPGAYVVAPESGHNDDLVNVIDSCNPGDRIILMAQQTTSIRLRSDYGNILTPAYKPDMYLGKGNVAGAESDIGVCELLKDPDGLWRMMGSGSDKDVRAENRMFTELDGARTYTATIIPPAHATVLDVRFSNSALWTAETSATLNVGDADDPDGYFDDVDVKTGPAANVNGAGGISSFLGGAGAYALSNVTADRTLDADNASLDKIADIVGTLIADLKKNAGLGAYAGSSKYSTNPQVITATIVTVGETGHAGHSRLTVIYSVSQGVNADMS